MDQSNSITFTPNRERGQHLKFEDRCYIKVLSEQGLSLRRIAADIGCSPTTVMNELKRGTGERKGTRGRQPGYSPKRGQEIYETNRNRCHKPHKINLDDPFIKWMIL